MAIAALLLLAVACSLASVQAYKTRASLLADLFILRASSSFKLSSSNKMKSHKSLSDDEISIMPDHDELELDDDELLANVKLDADDAQSKLADFANASADSGAKVDGHAKECKKSNLVKPPYRSVLLTLLLAPSNL